MFHNSGCASMGYEIPASIGAYHAKQREIICIAGDGSIMMNLQELTIIGEQQLPIKIFLLNNKGYHSIRQTQNNYFPSNTVGCGIESGLPFPSFKKVTEAFNIKYNKTMNEEKLASDIKETLSTAFANHSGFPLSILSAFTNSSKCPSIVSAKCIM